MFQTRKFYELDALRHNIWEADKKSNLYFKEMLRYKKILDLMPVNRGEVLDLGTGDGYLSCLLADRNYRVVALDISQNRLKKFEKQAHRLGIRQILGDAGHLPFAAESLDCVLASELLEHLPSYQDVVREIYRILKVSGTLILSVPYKERLTMYTCPYCLNRFHPNGHFNSFDQKSLSDVLGIEGFEIEKQILFRNRLTELMQRRLRLPFGKLITIVDVFLSKLFPDRSIYLAVRARRR